MRRAARADGISVHAISGTHAVLLAMNATESARRGLLGFAIGVRTASGAISWLRGFKFFEALVPNPQPGERRATNQHPIQSFLWGHYAAVPGRRHRYVVRPLYRPADGDLVHLRPGTDIEVTVETEGHGDRHAIFFNRGAIVSQAFADRFGNRPPADENDPTADDVRWLSRGLLEAALGFIAQATGPQFELRCAFYEFTYPPIAEALAAAAGRGAQVRVIYEAGHRKTDGAFEVTDIGDANKIMVEALGPIANLHFHPRTRHIAIPHNKFMVLLENGEPREVWTGSTNITASGFLGQSNVGHLVRDAAIAQAYNSYWEQLAPDPDRAVLKAWVAGNSPARDGALPPNSTTTLFSPRPSTAMLDWYGARMDEAAQTVLLTAAFGVTRRLAEYFDNDRDYLRFLLMERDNIDPETRAMLRRDRDTRIALGQALGKATITNKIEGWKLDQWFAEEEHFRRKGHVFYVHTKIMAIDLLTDDPLVFTGSANFSPNSLSSNDENMLLVRGDTRVADIYLTEFFRLFNHFFFRTVANAVASRSEDEEAAERAVFLDPTDAWVARHFRAGSYHSRRRELFGVAAE
jgi:phosphatidylserine/phosphatidylglycerophosphate/cardiolipin synthase-like enzyme